MSSPRLDKLFHVLVILGGATGVAACAGGDDDDSSSRDVVPDATPTDDGATAGDAGDSPDGGGKATACFCDVAACCDRTTVPPTLEDGFECCWSTSCD